MPALIFGAITLIVIGFGGGWLIKDWKDGAKVVLAVAAKEKVESRNAILEAANTNCPTDIEGVKKGVAVIVSQVEERERLASAAMKAADIQVAQHATKAKAIKELPPVPPEPEAQCAAIVQEQIDYVQARTQSSRK